MCPSIKSSAPFLSTQSFNYNLQPPGAQDTVQPRLSHDLASFYARDRFLSLQPHALPHRGEILVDIDQGEVKKVKYIRRCFLSALQAENMTPPRLTTSNIMVKLWAWFS